MIFDKRGVGLSDRVPEDRLPSLEVRIDDARAVMDAAGSERAVVLGHSEGGPMATLFAATYPGAHDRARSCSAPASAGTTRRTTRAASRHEDARQERRRSPSERERLWGTKELAASTSRSRSRRRSRATTSTVTWLADYMRNAASPGAANAFARMNSAIDVRSALPAIHVPTLVLARDDDLDFDVDETRWLADQIRGARFVSFPGDEHYIFFGNQDDLLG